MVRCWNYDVSLTSLRGPKNWYRKFLWLSETRLHCQLQNSLEGCSLTLGIWNSFGNFRNFGPRFTVYHSWQVVVRKFLFQFPASPSVRIWMFSSYWRVWHPRMNCAQSCFWRYATHRTEMGSLISHHRRKDVLIAWLVVGSWRATPSCKCPLAFSFQKTHQRSLLCFPDSLSR